ncbi:hypothetical protein [Nonomuraea sp. NPDC049400]|uniref:hypothetical protein n=1 Tax=Nonomuraea sp. NPDC049400 TaxID=3364352 RepID=UPI00378FCB0C
MSEITRIKAEHYHASRDDITGRVELNISGHGGSVVIDLGDDGDEILAGLLGFGDDDQDGAEDDGSGPVVLPAGSGVDYFDGDGGDHWLTCGTCETSMVAIEAGTSVWEMAEKIAAHKCAREAAQEQKGGDDA